MIGSESELPFLLQEQAQRVVGCRIVGIAFDDFLIATDRLGEVLAVDLGLGEQLPVLERAGLKLGARDEASVVRRPTGLRAVVSERSWCRHATSGG